MRNILFSSLIAIITLSPDSADAGIGFSSSPAYEDHHFASQEQILDAYSVSQLTELPVVCEETNLEPILSPLNTSSPEWFSYATVKFNHRTNEVLVMGGGVNLSKIPEGKRVLKHELAVLLDRFEQSVVAFEEAGAWNTAKKMVRVRGDEGGIENLKLHYDAAKRAHDYVKEEVARVKVSLNGD